jgi:long-chain acyl-CoA synthetase
VRVSDGPLLRGHREPDKIAIRHGERRLRYGELRAEILRYSSQVRGHIGDDSQLPVAFRFADPCDFLAAFLGVVEAGAIAVPLSSEWNEEQQRIALSVCPPALVLGDVSPGIRSLAADAHTASYSVRTARHSDQAFYVGFSSGSTGTPKAIVRSDRAWLQSFLAMTVEFGIGPDTTIAVPGSLFFSFSLIAALHILYLGGTLALPGSSTMADVRESLSGDAASAYILPSVLATFTRWAAAHGATFADMRQIICAGEKLPAPLRDAVGTVFPSALVREYYGASELGFVTGIDDNEARRRPGSVGRPFLGSELAILAPDGPPCLAGETGLVCARTEYGFSGYYGDPAGTHRIAHHGWQTVGDMGWRDADGYLYLAGRQDSMVVIKGENVYPEAVEHVLLAIDGIEAAAVVAEPEGSPTGLVAYVVTAGAGDAAGILAACSQRLPRHAVPRRVHFLDALPRTATGKFARTGLPRDQRAGP